VQPTVPAIPRQIVGSVHVVQRGETVYQIARKYGVTAEQIAEVNRLGRDYRIQPGQRLVVQRPTRSGIFFNQQPVKTDVTPFQQQGIAVTPFRHIFEHQGGKVDWKHDSKEVEARDEKRTIHLSIGSREAQVNQKTILMDLAAFIEQGRTIVPLRFIGEALDVTVQVDPQSGNIYITSNQ
jgi:LysM repeat protein